jgi:glycosyltransferase involved in cell wall biosynthesis
MLPSVSIIIPAYNAAATIQEAIATARAQTHRALEIIVIDDASTDDTLARIAAAAGPDLVVIRNAENAGGALTRNRGIEHARGDVIAFLDADDLWSPYKLALQLERLNASGEDAFCFCAVQSTNEYAERHILPKRGPYPGERLADFMLKAGHIVQTSSIVVPRHLLGRCRFTETLRRFQDIDFVLQLDGAGLKPVYVSQPLTEWRNVGNPKRVSANADSSIMRTFLERHGDRLSFAQRLGLEVRSFSPAPGILGSLRWSGRVLLSVATGALAVPNAISLLLKHSLGVRNFGALRSRLGVGS